MKRFDDALLDATVRDFLRVRAADTDGIRGADAMSAEIAQRALGLRRTGERAWSGRLVWVALLASLLLMAIWAVLVGGRRPPVVPLSVGNGVIAYAAEGSPSDIYLVRPGAAPRQIVGEGAGEGAVYSPAAACPTFSPNGTTLALGAIAGSFILVSVDPEGEVVGTRRLQTPGAESPHCASWAPDSASLAFLDGSALIIVPLEGPARRIDDWETAVASDAATFLIDYPPDRAVQWSRDGSMIAIARPSGTWLVPVKGGEARRLHDSPARTLSWAPDGTRLVVWTPAGSLVIRATDGTLVATLPPGNQPVWSPTGSRIAYVGAEASVYVVGPDGSDPRMVAGYGYDITWSPDGKEIMYIHDGCEGPTCVIGDTTFHGYALMSQAIDTQGAASGDPVIVAPMVRIASERSYPPAQSFSWQPVYR